MLQLPQNDDQIPRLALTPVQVCIALGDPAPHEDAAYQRVVRMREKGLRTIRAGARVVVAVADLEWWLRSEKECE